MRSSIVAAFAEDATRIKARAAIVFRIGHPWRFVIARSEATKQSSFFIEEMDCFAEPVIGRRFAPTRWLAMTITYFEATFGLP
jgi:hypothetical protein